MHTHIWYLGGLVVHSSSHAKGSEEPQPSAQPRQRLVLSISKHRTNHTAKSNQSTRLYDAALRNVFDN